MNLRPVPVILEHGHNPYALQKIPWNTWDTWNSPFLHKLKVQPGLKGQSKELSSGSLIFCERHKYTFHIHLQIYLKGLTEGLNFKSFRLLVLSSFYKNLKKKSFCTLEIHNNEWNNIKTKIHSKLSQYWWWACSNGESMDDEVKLTLYWEFLKLGDGYVKNVKVH